jgi:hypothetical protein
MMKAVFILLDKDGEVWASAATREIAEAIAKEDQEAGMEEMESYTIQGLRHYETMEDIQS